MENLEEQINRTKVKIALYNQMLDDLCKTDEVKIFLDLKKNNVVKQYLDTLIYIESERKNLYNLESKKKDIKR
mgnify:CR=1 FL=1